MCLTFGADCSSTKMGFEEKKEGEKSGHEESGDEKENHGNMKRVESEPSLCETEDEGEDAEGNKIQVGPQCTLKEQFEKDKVRVLLIHPIFFFFIIYVTYICDCLRFLG